MKRLRFLILTLTVFLTASVLADGIDYIVIENTDASTTQIALTDFKQIKFTDSQMMMLNDSGSTVATFMLKELHRMYFGPTESSDIDQPEWEAVGEVEVYSVSGILVKQGDMDLESLPRGIYIIRQGNKVVKVSRP
ncbi:MAG: T9SS type A sorting domain-containing protein [Prevotella sp.]|nr:T9SS type A sorting domain-containing protein [Prevotella sp.]